MRTTAPRIPRTASDAQGDLEFSDRLIDDSDRGVSSNGLPQSKPEFMHAIARSATSHSGAEHAERNVQIHGGMAISSSIATVHSQESAHSFRYMRIFLNAEGAWRLVASQSTHVREV